MQILGTIRSRSSYGYLIVGAAWLGVAFVAGSLLILWPVVACVVSGLLLMLKPGERLTWAWVLATAALGLLLAAYQVYSWAPFVVGAFAAIAGEAIAVFIVLGVVHGLLLFVGSSGWTSARSEPTQKTS